MHKRVASSELHTWPDAYHLPLSPVLKIHTLPPPKLLSPVPPASPRVSPAQLSQQPQTGDLQKDQLCLEDQHHQDDQ